MESKSLSDTTLKTYQGCLKRLNENYLEQDFIDDYKEVILYLKEKYPNLSSRKTYLCAVMYQVKDKSKEAYDAYKAEIDAMRPEITKIATNQLLTKDKEETYVKWGILKKAGKKAIELYQEAKMNLGDTLICVLYTEQAPVRADYNGMVFIRDVRQARDQKQNYCLLRVRNPCFIFNSYKTDASYGRVIIKIKPLTYTILIARQQEMMTKGENVLYTESQSNFSARVKEAFNKAIGKGVSINTLRHSFITSFLNTNPSIRKKEEISKLMMNSIVLQERYRVLNEDDLDKEIIDG